MVYFYSGRGTAEQWKKEGKYALNWTKLSCKHFVSNQVRLALFVLAYNPGNFLGRLALPREIKHWSLRTLLTRLIKIERRLSGTAGMLFFRWQRRLSAGSYLLKSCYELCDCDVTRPKKAAPWYELREKCLLFLLRPMELLIQPEKPSIMVRKSNTETLGSSWAVEGNPAKIEKDGYPFLFQF